MRILLLASAFTLAACSESNDPPVPFDAGRADLGAVDTEADVPAVDVAVDRPAPIDAPATDVGSDVGQVDVGTDSGSDAGPRDVGTVIDVAADHGTAVDIGAATDSGAAPDADAAMDAGAAPDDVAATALDVATDRDAATDLGAADVGTLDDATEAPDAADAPDAAPDARDAGCAAGEVVCDGLCTTLATDPSHCGACGTTCDAPARATAVCAASACGFICDAGFVRSGARCVAPTPPRPIAPLSTATVTSRRPRLRWALSTGDGARVTLCRDRALIAGCVAFDATGTSGAPATELTAGVWFWRAATRSGGVTTDATGPTWQFTVGARSAPVNASWGTTLDVNGDGYSDLAVGASFAATSTGRAYVYLGGATGLATSPSTALIGPDGMFGAFGSSLASAGDVNGDGYADLVVGAQSAASLAGRAYVYFGSAGGLATTPSVALNGPAGMTGAFGASVAGAGDVNGDGYADLVVGASAVGPDRAGEAYVYLGSATGPATSPTTTLPAPDAQRGNFGASAASAGDVNGDGYADIIIGAPYLMNQMGRAYVYLGNAAGLVTAPTLRIVPPTGPYGSFGASVAGVGDVNGDGYADVAVGATSRSGDPAGHAYVYLGGAAGPTTPAATTYADPRAGSFGCRVAGAGDVNGDGYADLAVGAYAQDRVDVYPGSATGLATSAAPQLRGPGAEFFGYTVAGVGDINGDGYADLAVTAYQYSAGTGRAYVFHGDAVGLATVPSTTLTGSDGMGAYFGQPVASRLGLPGNAPAAPRVRRFVGELRARPPRPRA